VASRQTGTATSILRALLGAAGRDIRLKVDGVSIRPSYFAILRKECKRTIGQSRQMISSTASSILTARIQSQSHGPIAQLASCRPENRTKIKIFWQYPRRNAPISRPSFSRDRCTRIPRDRYLVPDGAITLLQFAFSSLSFSLFPYIVYPSVTMARCHRSRRVDEHETVTAILIAYIVKRLEIYREM